MNLGAKWRIRDHDFVFLGNLKKCGLYSVGSSLVKRMTLFGVLWSSTCEFNEADFSKANDTIIEDFIFYMFGIH